ncbi:MAG: YciI family protein [Candidatus Bathyarchaeota archaeon]|nr:YciI family protein [Candidatus Bathyarchaeota archaeon]
MVRHFAYFYFNKQDPKIPSVVPIHVEYWKTSEVKGYMGGPFVDKSGGLIIFRASSLEEAMEVIMKDPFILEDLIERKWIKEWMME